VSLQRDPHRRVLAPRNARDARAPQSCTPTQITNARMNQFKDVFFGIEKRDYNRATTT
jgi:hypothetical protein